MLMCYTHRFLQHARTDEHGTCACACSTGRCKERHQVSLGKSGSKPAQLSPTARAAVDIFTAMTWLCDSRSEWLAHTAWSLMTEHFWLRWIWPCLTWAPCQNYRESTGLVIQPTDGCIWHVPLLKMAISHGTDSGV
jgi:hypothetical protein